MACVARSFVAEGAHIITDSIQPVTGSADVSSAQRRRRSVLESEVEGFHLKNQRGHAIFFTLTNFRASRSVRTRRPRSQQYEEHQGLTAKRTSGGWLAQ